MVLYTDGSARPNPGYIGYGIHGYTFWPTHTNRNYGHDGYYLTNQGYTVKTKGKENAVTPCAVIDAYGSYQGKATNNTAEVLGVQYALEIAKANQASHLLIKTDSEYARKGYSEWLDQWKKNNWCNKEGRPISNQIHWKQIDLLKQELQSQGTEVNVLWVKGHNGQPGNERADQLSNMGRELSVQDKLDFHIQWQAADTYWKQPVLEERHPLCSKAWMYFKAKKSLCLPGEYYFGNIGKDDEFLGKRMADAGYCLVQTKKPIDLLEKVRDIQIEQSQNKDITIVLSMRTLYHGMTANDVLFFGQDALCKTHLTRNDLSVIGHETEYLKEVKSDDEEDTDDEEEQFLQSEPLTREQIPPFLSSRAFDHLGLLKTKLLDYQSDNRRHNTYIDITEEFYEIETKLVKKELQTKYKLKSHFKPGTVSHDVKVEYLDQSHQIRLVLTNDLPDRNALKRLESYCPKIILVLWPDSTTSFKYACVIETTDASSIWSSYHANTVYY